MEPLAKTLSVPDAGRIYFGIAPGAAYAAVKRGQIPSLRIGRKLRVPVAALEKMLADATPVAPDAVLCLRLAS